MKAPSVVTKLANLLFAPALPARALAITEASLVLVALRRRQGEYEAVRAGMVSLPPGLVKADFEQPNIGAGSGTSGIEESRFVSCLEQVAAQAGLRRVGQLSVALPAGSARTFLLSLDNIPSSKAEMAQLVDWKIERSTGYPVDELRISRRRLGDLEGYPQWLIGAVHRRVLSQYESLFDRVGWRAGLITPRVVGEASWLRAESSGEDLLLVSVNPRGFELMVLRAGEPLLVRDVECAPGEVENEFFRLMIYYRDRLIPEGAPPRLGGILTVSTPAEQQFFRDLAAAALEQPVLALSAAQIGLRLDPGYTLPQMAAAAGLAALAG